MPYRSVRDLPKDQTDQYSGRAKEAFRMVFNRVHERTGSDEQAFKAAHAAAKRVSG